MSQENYTTLVACLAEIPDPRDRRGRRYEWVYWVTLVALALLAGQRNVRAMAQWVAERREDLVLALAPKRGTVPSAATFGRILATLDVEQLEAQVRRYLQQLDQRDVTQGRIEWVKSPPLVAQALDGKTVRGASKHGADVHLVSLVRHGSGTVLAQQRVATKIDERQAAHQLLQGRQMQNTVTTFDALHTQTKLAEQILAHGGHYLMVVKGNQRDLQQEVAATFAPLPTASPHEQQLWGYQCVQTQEKGHGRMEQRRLESVTGLTDYLTWPGVAQVLRRTCRRRKLHETLWTQEVHYAVTSLDRTQVTLAQLEQLWRGHWTIENVPHYIRDVSWGEDHCQVRSGHAPQVLAALRNALLSLLRYEGWPLIPTAHRHFDANLQHALRFVGALSS